MVLLSAFFISDHSAGTQGAAGRRRGGCRRARPSAPARPVTAARGPGACPGPEGRARAAPGPRGQARPPSHRARSAPRCFWPQRQEADGALGRKGGSRGLAPPEAGEEAGATTLRPGRGTSGSSSWSSPPLAARLPNAAPRGCAALVKRRG